MDHAGDEGGWGCYKVPLTHQTHFFPSVKQPTLDKYPTTPNTNPMKTQRTQDFSSGLDEDDLDELANTTAKVQRQVIPGVSPGALLDAMENPDVFQEVARGDLYVQMAKLRTAAQDPRMTPAQRLEYARFLARMGKVDQPDRENNPMANLPMIEIDLGSGQSVKIGSAARAETFDAERDVTPKPSSAVLP